MNASVRQILAVALFSPSLAWPTERTRSLPHDAVQGTSKEAVLQALQQQALPDLIHSLSKPKKTVSGRFVGVVGGLQDARALAYFVQAYDQNLNEGVRCKLIEGIGRLHEPAMLPWLAKRAGDPLVSIQCFAIWAIGELRSPEAAATIRHKLWNADPNVQMTTMNALSKCGRDPEASAQLLTLLRDNDVQLRFLAAQSLVGIASPTDVPDMINVLVGEQSVDVQEALAETVGRIGGRAGMEPLIELLRHPRSPGTEHWTQVGLTFVPPEILIPGLTPLIEGNDFQIKLSALRVLTELGASSWDTHSLSAREQVRRWAIGSDPDVRIAAQKLLTQLDAAATKEATP